MKIRDRVLEMKRVKASELRRNDKNPNVHGDAQRKTMRGILAEIGFAGAELCYYSERNGGALTLIDGELRMTESGNTELPCLITDLDDAEADKLLLLFDPVRAMADQDDARINALLDDVRSEDDAVNELLEQLAKDHKVDLADTELKQLDVRPPPKMSWALVGIETVRFGEIAEHLDALGLVDGIFIETSVNDVEVENEQDDTGHGQSLGQSQPGSEAGSAPPHAEKVARPRRR